jgi:arylsulfatase
MVAQLDHAVGRVLVALAETGQADDTLVIVTTDHGELLGDHQMLFKGPLHYDGLLRVPLIISSAADPASAGTSGASIVAAPVGTIDLVPTILELAGMAIPAHVDGRSLRPFLLGPHEPREWVLTENDHEMGMTLHLRTITTDRYVLTRYDTMAGIGELYDHAVDPGEFENRWDDPSYASIRSDLLALLGDVANPHPRRLPNTGSLA